jgi:murein DD-endopeptidase MepM/ murein hydrolase activator NlpD
VTYVGNELKGYGNLILLRHENGYVTAYAHTGEIVVERGQRVVRGQTIAFAGATGSVSEPQLHFEIRRGTQPIDPKPLLMAVTS